LRPADHQFRLDHEFRARFTLPNDCERFSPAISGTPIGMFRNAAEQRLGQLRAELAYTDTHQIVTRGLHEFLDAFQTKLNLVDQGIYDTFFALRPVASSGQNQVSQ
jgi:hypothetical protein